MAITTTKIGNNTWQLDIPVGSTESELFTELDTILTTAGWSAFDTTNHVYTAPNVDGQSTKMTRIVYDSTNMSLKLHCIENWDSNTATETNSVVGSTQYANGQYLDMTNYSNTLYVMCTTKWLVLLNYNFDLDSWGQQDTLRGHSFTGIFELTRWHPEDTATAGYPPYVWMTGGSLVTCSVGICRSRNDVVDPGGKMICTTLGARYNGVTNKLSDLSTLIPNENEIWQNKVWVSDLFYACDCNLSTPDYRGYIYGIKVIQDLAITPNYMDTVDIPCTSEGFFDPNTGTATRHRLMLSNQVSNSGPAKMVFAIID